MAGMICGSAGVNNGCTVLFGNGVCALLQCMTIIGYISYIMGRSDHRPGSVEH